jgi:8-oxo-dGTP pyrophosphatase MutT (NUDIX family)
MVLVDEIPTSVGIICFKLNKKLQNIFIQNIKKTSYYDLNNIIVDNIHKFNEYNDSIEFLLVKRRNSLNYIDFIRGKYHIQDNKQINNMFTLMSTDEINMIKTNDFNTLWCNLWLKNAYKKKYLEEMNLAKIKFYHLKKTGKLDNINSEYLTTEWEIPKGKKHSNETNLQCAIRELKEETSLSINNYDIISCLDPIHDIFTGTNNKEYKHIFYTALCNNDNININIEYKNNEIEEIRWCKWSELNEYIRPYNNNKINILTNIFLFILNICEKNDNNENILLTI